MNKYTEFQSHTPSSNKLLCQEVWQFPIHFFHIFCKANKVIFFLLQITRRHKKHTQKIMRSFMSCVLAGNVVAITTIISIVVVVVIFFISSTIQTLYIFWPLFFVICCCRLNYDFFSSMRMFFVCIIKRNP